MVNSSENEIRSTLNPFTELFRSNQAEVNEAGVNERVVSAEPIVNEDAAPVEVVGPTVTKVDSLATDSNNTTIPAEAPIYKSVTAVVEPKPVAANGNFYVIAGAFKGQKQANVLLADLTKKGFSDAFIIPANKYSKKVKVAVNSYDSEKDAYRASARLKDVIGEAGWVLKKR